MLPLDTIVTTGGGVFFQTGVLCSLEKKSKIFACFGQFGQFCCQFTHTLLHFLQTQIIRLRTKNDKYQVCHYLFKIQIKCKRKVDGVLDPFKSLLPPIFRKYKLKLRKLFVLNDDGDFVPRFQQIRRLWSESAATSGQRLSDCVGSFITVCHHHCIDLIVLSLFQTLFRQCTMG